MGLEELRAEILRRTSEEVKRIESEAAVEEKKVLDAAESERRAMLENAKKEAEAIAEAERNERLASARLKARKLLVGEREALVENAVAMVRERFFSVTRTPAYASLLKKLVEQGVAEVGEGAVVHLNARDRELLKRVKNARIADEPAAFVGGAVVESADGRVRVRNNLEALFEEYAGDVRKLVHSSVFKKGGE